MNFKTKRRLKAFLNLGIVIIGNTVGIWLLFLVVQFFDGIISDIKWPGIKYFSENGTFIIMGFSFFTTALSYSISARFLNKYSTLSILGLIATAVIYAKYIGSMSKNPAYISNQNIGQYLILTGSIILLFIVFIKRRLIYAQNSWLSNASTLKNDFDIFISYAISSIKNKEKEEEIKNQTNLIVNKLKSLGYKKIFFVETIHKYEPSHIAACDDFNAIENSKNFILFYPVKAASSALIELGYALREGLNIIILCPNIKNLPFLIQNMPHFYSKGNIIEYKNMTHLIDTINKHHKDYLI